MRLFVVDNNLVDKAGHFFAVDCWIREEAKKRAMDVRFYINQSAADEIVETLSARAVFSYRSYAGISRDKYSGDVDNFLHVGGQFAKDLQSLSDEGLSADDLVYFPMTNQNDLYGCALWLDSIPRQSRPYVCMNFMRPNFVNAQNDSLTIAGILYRSASRILLKLLGKDRLIYTAQSSRIAKFLSWVLSHSVTESPMLHTYNLPNPQDQTAAMEKIIAGECRISIIGSARSEKGFDLVPDLLGLLSKKNTKLNFFVQVTTELNDWQNEITRMQNMANVELHLGTLGEAAYIEKMQNSDIILLPYHPLRYKYLTSGIFAEAVAMGKVVVAPDSSWMAEHIKNKRGAGKLFKSFDPQSIADAVLAAIEDFGTLQPEAKRYAESWQQEQNLGKYIDGILTSVDNRNKEHSLGIT